MQTRLPFFGVVRVSGEDRASFLHGQLSNDINNLAIGQACYATYNTPKGRVLANSWSSIAEKICCWSWRKI